MSSFGAPPLIYIGGSHDQQGRFQQVILPEPTSRTNGELPLRSVGAMARSADLRPAPNRPNFGWVTARWALITNPLVIALV